MLCINCGTETRRTLDVVGGQQIATHVCPKCYASSGKEIVTPNILMAPSIPRMQPMKAAHYSGTTERVADYIVNGNKATRYVARILSPSMSEKYDRHTPENWTWQQNIIPRDITPPSSGLGYKFSPYTSLWTMMWGVTPTADLSKYRLMYRTVPKVKRAIDKTVSSAIIKGFNRLEITDAITTLPKEYKNEEEYKEAIVAYVNAWISGQDNFGLVLHQIASDMLTYGNAYVELVYEELEVTNKQEDSLMEFETFKDEYDWAGKGVLDIITEDPIKRIANPDGMYREVASKGNLLWLKPIDPLYMRVRADAYGNVFGYLQFLSVPPIAFTPEKMAHFRYSPKSWQYETVNGTSILMSLIRTQEIIWQIENDLILLGHACVKPPMLFMCGTDAESPWTADMFNDFINATAGRKAGGDIYVRNDVKAEPLPAPAAGIPAMRTYLDYHDTQRTIALGVPPQLLGEPEGSSRTTAEVSLDDWVNMLQNLQKEISNTLEDQIFRHVVHNAFDENAPIPKPVWNPLFDKNENDIVSRIVSLKASNIITLNEARLWLNELNIKLEAVENGNVMQEVEMLDMELEQMQMAIDTPPEEAASSEKAHQEVRVNHNRLPNIEQNTFKLDQRPAPGTSLERLASKYKISEAVSFEDVIVFTVSDRDIKLDLDKDWVGSGSSKTHDFISDREIWLSDTLNSTEWNKMLKEEYDAYTADLDSPGVGDDSGSNQLMYPGLPKKPKTYLQSLQEDIKDIKASKEDMKADLKELKANKELENKLNIRKLEIMEQMIK